MKDYKNLIPAMSFSYDPNNPPSEIHEGNVYMTPESLARHSNGLAREAEINTELKAIRESLGTPENGLINAFSMKRSAYPEAADSDNPAFVDDETVEKYHTLTEEKYRIRAERDKILKSRMSIQEIAKIQSEFIKVTDEPDSKHEETSYVAEILTDEAPAVLPKVDVSKPSPIVVQSLPQESIPKWKPLDGVKRVMSVLPVRTIGDRIYIFDGCCFRQFTKLKAARCLRNICKGVYDDIGRATYLYNVVEGLLVEPSLELTEEEVEQNHFLTFKNRTIDVDTGIDYPNSPNFGTMHCLNCCYTPENCTTPRFDQFLRSITGGDPVLQQRIWQAIGCTIVPDMKVKKMILLQGVPNSGKSVLVNLVLKLFEENDVTSITIDRFADRFSRATLIDAYMCTIPDMPEGCIKSETVSYLKQFSGGDLVSTDVKNRDQVNFHCKTRFWAATNNRFIVSGNDTAMLDRIVVIPFAYAPAEGQRDTRLLDELLKERDAIATRALFAYFDLVRANYRFAGDYKLNAVVQESAVDKESLGYCVDEFMRKSIEIVGINEAELLPVEILITEFCDLYPIHSGLEKGKFSTAVNDWLEDNGIPKRHTRKRTPLMPTNNPVSVFLGFRLKK